MLSLVLKVLDNYYIIIFLILIIIFLLVFSFIKFLKSRKTATEPEQAPEESKLKIEYSGDFIKSIITFIINESKEGNIKLGVHKNSNNIFVAFKNPEVNNFINDFYHLNKLNESGGISEETFDAFNKYFSSKYQS